MKKIISVLMVLMLASSFSYAKDFNKMDSKEKDFYCFQAAIGGISAIVGTPILLLSLPFRGPAILPPLAVISIGGGKLGLDYLKYCREK